MNISEKLFAPLFQLHFSNRSLSLLSCLKRQFLYSDLHDAIYQNSIITPFALERSTTKRIFLSQYLLIMGRSTHSNRKSLPPSPSSGAVGWGTALQAGRSRVRFSMCIFGIFHRYNPSSSTLTLGSTQPVTEMSTRNISWVFRRPVLRADNFTIFICRFSWNLGTWTFWNTQGLSRPVQELLYLYQSYIC